MPYSVSLHFFVAAFFSSSLSLSLPNVLCDVSVSVVASLLSPPFLPSLVVVPFLLDGCFLLDCSFAVYILCVCVPSSHLKFLPSLSLASFSSWSTVSLSPFPMSVVPRGLPSSSSS